MTRREAQIALYGLLFKPTETKPRPAHEIALDARRAERRAEDEARAAKRLYPTKGKQ